MRTNKQEVKPFFLKNQAISDIPIWTKMAQQGNRHGPPGMDQGVSQPKPLYSQQLKIRFQKSERLNKSVLEINLGKEKSAEAIEDEVIE